MKTVSSKELLKFTFNQMEKLDKGKIDTDSAKAQGNLIKQANNLLKYELDRANTLMKISQHNTINGSDLQLRDIEGHESN